jgi:GT2 family glycosyltransferase
MPDLSIILPTCNRAPLLGRTLACIWAFARCDYEIVIVDGASSDATPQVVQDASMWAGERIKLIREAQREGFVRAANKGFAAATGRYAMWLNDDARPVDGAIDTAVQLMDAAGDDVGLLAAYHRSGATRSVAHQVQHAGERYVTMHVRGTLYANFGIGRRDVLERLGFLDDRYFVNGADPDLSLKAWNAGLRVLPAEGVLIDHAEHNDERRAGDADQGRLDNEKLFAKWDLPPRNDSFNDFDPANPCTLRGLRQVLAVAA